MPRPRIESEEDEYWTFNEENEHFSFDTDKLIDFYGPHSWQLTFDEYKIDFVLGLRYAIWFEQKYGFRNIEWRKMIYKVVKLFGGDRVIYLPDNIIQLYDISIMDDPFEEIEKHLQTNYGDPKKTFKEVATNFEKNYFIDRFEDLVV